MRLRYAGDVRPVAVKLSAWKGSAAHPKHSGAKSGVGGSTEMLVDGHRDHSGAIFDDGDAPVAAVDKTVNQLGTKHHGNKAELEVH